MLVEHFVTFLKLPKTDAQKNLVKETIISKPNMTALVNAIKKIA